jgi:hypothetical protein
LAASQSMSSVFLIFARSEVRRLPSVSSFFTIPGSFPWPWRSPSAARPRFQSAERPPP